MADHLIWGKAELLEGFSDESSTSSRQSSKYNKKLPSEVLKHLENVEFKDESEGSRSEKLSDISNRLSETPGFAPSMPACGRQLLARQEVARPVDIVDYSAYAIGFPSGSRHLPAPLQQVAEHRGSDSVSSSLPQVNQGSEALHDAGECKPCLYLNSRTGCLNGKGCRFCHLPHLKKNRPRPCKAKRNQCKQIVNMLHAVFGEDSQEFQQASERLSCESTYMRSILGKQNDPVAEKDSRPPATQLASGSDSVRQTGELGALFGQCAAELLSETPDQEPRQFNRDHTSATHSVRFDDRSAAMFLSGRTGGTRS
mmetsp:Transcript_16116/g.25784  ORF Transcript_16116/g.25784 Transcript_16116/m.25784 type:complete len:312 (+) Transcript_16116:80-1015(+)